MHSVEGAIENLERDILGLSDGSMLGKLFVLSSAVVSPGCSSDQTPLSLVSFETNLILVVRIRNWKYSTCTLGCADGGLEKAGFCKGFAERVRAVRRASAQSLYNYRWNA
ncbi:MAG: hypothetical protein N0E61_15060 [Candidatus Thiodiazotropha endolucinida]|nr:hypothetical protein [Candidatus Thiodiazotropha endolucinida]